MRAIPALLAVLLSVASFGAHGQVLPLEIARLAVPASAEDVRNGHYDARFEVLPTPAWRPQSGHPAYWFRLKLPKDRPDRDLVLAVDRLPVDALSLHLPLPGGEWRVLTDGTRDANPGAQASPCCYAFALPRELPGATLYLAVEDTVPSRLVFSVMPWDEFAARDRTAVAVTTFALLALLSMALLNALFFAFLREREYALLVAFQLSLVPWLAHGAGLFAGLPERQLPGMPGLFPWLVFAGMSAFFGAAFIQRSCCIAERHPRFSAVMDALRWLVLGMSAASILPLPQQADLLRHSFNLSLLGLALFAFATPLLSLRAARRPALFVMLGWSLMVAALIWRVRFAMGFGEVDLIAQYGLQLAVALMAVVLTIGLADRALGLRQQRDRAQSQRDLAESRLRVAQTRRSLAESLELLVQHAGSDLTFTAYKRALAALRHVLPMRGAAWVAQETDGRRVLVAEPAAVRDKVSEYVRKRTTTLRSVAQTGRSIVISVTDTDESSIDGTPLSAAVVPLHPDGCAWSVLLIARESGQGFAPEDFDIARDFLALAAKAAAAGQRHVALKQKASFDALTGALNRGNIESTVETAFGQAIHARAPMAVLFIDLDHFKRVNDQHGHAAGDECLVRVTQRIERQLKPGQALGRYGGEEFLVVLPGASVDEARSIAERIRESVRERPISTDQLDIPLTVSIGGASRQPGELSWKHMLERADQALYAAKRSGRDRVVWGDSVAAQTG